MLKRLHKCCSKQKYHSKKSCYVQPIILQLDSTSCHLQLDWSCLQPQNWHRIIYGWYGCVCATTSVQNGNMSQRDWLKVIHT
jgi:hypothetical protein